MAPVGRIIQPRPKTWGSGLSYQELNFATRIGPRKPMSCSEPPGEDFPSDMLQLHITLIIRRISLNTFKLEQGQLPGVRLIHPYHTSRSKHYLLHLRNEQRTRSNAVQRYKGILILAYR
jgi:hypothetical protein